MAVADQIAAIGQAKTAIVAAVNSKGGTLAPNPPIASIAPAITALPTGGEADVVGTFLDEYGYICLDFAALDCKGHSGILTGDLVQYSTVEEVRNAQNVTSIGLRAFLGCDRLTHAEFPRVTAIDSAAFEGCASLEYIHVGTALTAVATLADTYVFDNTPTTMKIVVPDNMVTQYKAATNWSTYASRIIGISDWEALQG